MSEVTKPVFETDLSSLQPYILGKKFTGKVKKRAIVSAEMLEDFLTMLEEDLIAKEFFDAYSLSKDFYNTMVDFKHFFPADVRDEVFYAAKVGKIYRQIPSFCVYILQKSWEQCDGIPNMLLKIIPTSALKKFFEEGYLTGGVTLKDAICNVCCEEYDPLCLYHPRNKMKEFTEVYVESTDMVAAIPTDIADSLDDNAIYALRVGSNGLEVNGILLRTMCGRVGAVSSIYDLRRVI